MNKFRFLTTLEFHLPKKAGSIRYQFTNPATNPITNTINAPTFSAIVLGFPTRDGNSNKYNPPIPINGPNAASFIEYVPSLHNSRQLM